MMIKEKKIHEFLQSAYMCFLVVYMVVREVVPLQFLIDNIIVSAVIFGVGFGLIIWDLFTERRCLQGRAIDFFVVFLAICVLSSLLNYRYGIGSNIKCIAAMVLEYFLFFPMGFKENRAKNFRLLLNTLIVSLFVFVLVSNLMYLFSIDYSVISGRGSGDQGYDTTWGRLWGVFGDPNVACYISLVAVFASAFLMYVYKKVWAYIVYGISILTQMTFIMLSLSRSGLLLMIAIPVVSALYIVLSYIRTDKKRALLGCVLSIAVSAVLYGGYFGLMQGLPYGKVALLNSISPQTREAIVTTYDKAYKLCGVEILNIEDNHIKLPDPDDENQDPDATIKTELEKIDRKDEKDDYSNGRFARWSAGIAVFKTTPILGTSPRNAVAIAKERTPDTVMGKYGWVTHCAYLEVLVNTGIVGAIVMFACLGYIAFLFLRAAIKKGFDSYVYVAFLCFIMVAAGAFFVSDVFFVFSICTLLFYYLLGYLYSYSKPNDKSVVGALFAWLGKGKKREENSDLRS